MARGSWSKYAASPRCYKCNRVIKVIHWRKEESHPVCDKCADGGEYANNCGECFTGVIVARLDATGINWHCEACGFTF